MAAVMIQMTNITIQFLNGTSEYIASRLLSKSLRNLVKFHVFHLSISSLEMDETIRTFYSTFTKFTQRIIVLNFAPILRIRLYE